MIVRQYRIDYSADSNNAVRGTNALTQALNSLTAATGANTTAFNKQASTITSANVAANRWSTNLQQINAHTNTARAGTLSWTIELVKAQAAFAALQGAVEIARAIGEGIAKARQHMMELGEEAIKFRRELGEIAAIRGGVATTPMTREILGTAIQANMTPSNISNFLREFEGVIPAGLDRGTIGPGMNKPDREKLIREIAVAGASIGQKNNISPATSGLMTGIIASNQKVSSASDVAGTLGSVTSILHAGRGRVEDLMRGLADVTGELVDEQGGAPFTQITDAAAVFSGLSIAHSPSATRTYTKALFRSYTDGSGEAIGITARTPGLEAITKFHDYLTEQTKAGKGAHEALIEIGFTDARDRAAIIESHRSYESIMTRAKMPESITGEKVMADTAKFYKTEEAGIAYRIEATTAATKADQGLKHEIKALAHQRALNALRDEGSLMSPEQTFADKMYEVGNFTDFSGAPGGLEARIMERAWSDMEASLIQAGLYEQWKNIHKEDWYEPNRRKGELPTIRGDRYNEAINEGFQLLKGAGLDPLPTGRVKQKIVASGSPPASVRAPATKRQLQPGEPGGPLGPPTSQTIKNMGVDWNNLPPAHWQPKQGRAIDPETGDRQWPMGSGPFGFPQKPEVNNNSVGGLLMPNTPRPRPIQDLNNNDSIEAITRELRTQTALLRDATSAPGRMPQIGGKRA
jgi:hypothetical protein